MERLERLLEETDREQILAALDRQEVLRKRTQDIPQELIKAQGKRAGAEQMIEQRKEAYTQAIQDDEKARQNCDNAYQHLLAQFETYPTEMLSVIKQQMDGQARQEIAQEVLSERLESSEQDWHGLRKILEDRQNIRQADCYNLFNEINGLLHTYGPQINAQAIVTFVNAEQANALVLLTRLGGELQQQKLLLDARERELFREFLLEELANTLGQQMTEAEAWVDHMNSILDQTPFVGEHYSLKWTPRSFEHERGQSGSRLAQYHDLLRRQAQTYKQEEIEQLVEAFRQEIDLLDTRSTTFTETLIRVLDYRTWFQFDFYLRRPNGSPLHLNNRFFKKGCGAEQFAMLYLPLFVTFSALYESAGAGAPRLIALDEAFERVSQEHIALPHKNLPLLRFFL